MLVTIWQEVMCEPASSSSGDDVNAEGEERRDILFEIFVILHNNFILFLEGKCN